MKEFTPKKKLVKAIENTFKLNLDNDQLKEIPTKWQRRGDLIILPITSFQQPFWEELGKLCLYACYLALIS